MKLGQSELLRVFDDHHRRVRYVHPDLDDRRCDHHIHLSTLEAAHDDLLLIRTEAAVQQAEPQPPRRRRGNSVTSPPRPAERLLGGLRPVGAARGGRVEVLSGLRRLRFFRESAGVGFPRVVFAPSMTGYTIRLMSFLATCSRTRSQTSVAAFVGSLAGHDGGPSRRQFVEHAEIQIAIERGASVRGSASRS